MVIKLIFGLLIVRLLTLAASVMFLALKNISNIQQPSNEKPPNTSIATLNDL